MSFTLKGSINVKNYYDDNDNDAKALSLSNTFTLVSKFSKRIKNQSFWV